MFVLTEDNLCVWTCTYDPVKDISIPTCFTLRMDDIQPRTTHEWQYKKQIGKGETFVWSIVEDSRGIVIYYALRMDKDPLHGGKPYYWSSNETVLSHITKLDVVGDSGGRAYLRKEVQLPNGYVWRDGDDNHFIVKSQLIERSIS